MLYEVITQPEADRQGRRQGHPRRDHRRRPVDRLGGAGAGAERRITSYNVCYTKLLRQRNFRDHQFSKFRDRTILQASSQKRATQATAA